MSGVRFALNSGELQTTTTTKTLLQALAAANHRALLKEIGFSGKGIVSTDAPIFLEVVRQTSQGSTSALTPVKWNSSDLEDLEVTAFKDCSPTGEPTDAGEVVLSAEVHPQGGMYEWISPYGWEYPLVGGQRLGIRVKSGVDIKAVTRILGEE